jgi:hypothetical protein
MLKPLYAIAIAFDLLQFSTNVCRLSTPQKRRINEAGYAIHELPRRGLLGNSESIRE